MKNTIVHIETEKKRYPLVFNLNVMEEIQEKYGSLDKWGELTKGGGEPNIKDLKAGIKIMLNEAIDMENGNWMLGLREIYEDGCVSKNIKYVMLNEIRLWSFDEDQSMELWEEGEDSSVVYLNDIE